MDSTAEMTTEQFAGCRSGDLCGFDGLLVTVFGMLLCLLGVGYGVDQRTAASSAPGERRCRARASARLARFSS